MNKIFTLPALIALSVASPSYSATLDSAFPHPEMIFATNKSILEKCASRDGIQIALENAAYQSNATIAARDVLRVMNTCDVELRHPRRVALKMVIEEALSKAECADGACSKEDIEALTEVVVDARERMKEPYAYAVVDALKQQCGTESMEVTCVPAALENATLENFFAFPWLHLTSNGRILATGDLEVKDKDLSELKNQLFPKLRGMPSLWSEDLQDDDLNEHFAGLDISFSDLQAEWSGYPLRVSVAGDFIKVHMTPPNDECDLLENMEIFKLSGATEILVGNRLFRGKNEDLCSSSRELTFSYERDE